MVGQFLWLTVDPSNHLTKFEWGPFYSKTINKAAATGLLFFRWGLTRRRLNGANVAPGNLYPNPVCYFNRQGLFIHSGYAAVEAATCNDLVTFFEISDHLSVFFGSFLLGPYQ